MREKGLDRGAQLQHALMALFAVDVAEFDEMGEVIVLRFCFDCPEGRGGCTCMKSHPVSSAAMAGKEDGGEG